MTDKLQGTKGHPFLAMLMDYVMRPMERLRKKVVLQASGVVLEVGVGTGLNLPEYKDIEALYGVEPDPYMLRRAQKRAEGVSFPVELHKTGGEMMPFEDEFFDTVVVTWVLCSIPEPQQALAEIYRVLRPGGRLLYVEHTHSHFPFASRIQNLFNPVWRRMAGGCNINRDSVSMIQEAGFSDVQTQPSGRESWTLFPMYRGMAIK